MEQTLTIIIPTRNEEKNLDALLSSLAGQLDKQDETIVVDANSTDGTQKIAKRYGAKVVVEPGLGMGYARTLGAENSKNNILVFLDADCVLEKEFIRKIKLHFKKDIVAIAGLGLYRAESKLRWEIYNAFSRGVFYSAKISHKLTGKYWLPANNCAIRKDAFMSVGGYSPLICDETDLMKKLPPAKNVIYDSTIKNTLSDRRFRKDGFLRTLITWGMHNVLVMVGKGENASKKYSKAWNE